MNRSASVAAAQQLPSVDRVLTDPAAAPLVERYGRTVLRDALRAVFADARERIRDHGGDSGHAPALPRDIDGWLDEVLARLRARGASGPRPVLNLTGTVIHTNLGRAPLADAARAALVDASGAADVEFDLHEGNRGHRDDHVEALLRTLTGAEAATVVNNCAAAVLLVLNTFALGREVPVARGELVEIGGAFRMPDIMARAGVRLREIGTTNRTHARDYEAAIGPETALLMKVHPSNYAIEGFTHEVDLETFAAIARRAGLVSAWDLGSGALLADPADNPGREPTPAQGLRAGIDLVLFSGDKLLGGPQCGIVVGTREHVEALRANPLARALRVDKLTLAALAATLRLWCEPERARREVPALALLRRPQAALRALAEHTAPLLRDRLPEGWVVEVEDCSSQIGSGALPVERLPSAAIVLRREDGDDGAVRALAARLRAAPVPVIGRIRESRLLFDCRTLDDPATLASQFDGVASDGVAPDGVACDGVAAS